MVKRRKKTSIVNAFRCRICGKIVAPIHRSRHLIVAHKLSGYNVKNRFTDLGTPFRINPNAKSDAARREFERNLKHPNCNKAFTCGAKLTDGTKPQYIKIIYTPMGNKR